LIDLDALRHNYRLARSLAGNGQCLPIIKANAYGHGAVGIAKALETLAPAFGVACIEEAQELRSAGIKAPILLLEGPLSADEIIAASQQNYWLTVETPAQAHAVIAASLPTPLNIWLKVDTGMHRLGLAPEEVQAVYRQLRGSDNVAMDIVLATHLACADELDNDFSLQQIERFKGAVAGIDAQLSIANSPGLLGWPQSMAQWNRPGYMLYGNSPFSVAHPQADQLKPVMTLQSAVISVRNIVAGEAVGYSSCWRAARPSRIATIAVGYGDGYPRSAPNDTPVLIGGQRARLVGRVSMDMITVDVTDLSEVKVGDAAILWGPGLTANEVAQWAGTIGYELLTRMPSRPPRIYLG
jgi:alanine racemase